MHAETSTGKRLQGEQRRLDEVAKIKGMLIRAKLTLTQIDTAYHLPAGTAGNTLYEPHKAGERAIAAALTTKPHLLWRTRYHGSGRRKSPQPAENYRYGRRTSMEAA